MLSMGGSKDALAGHGSVNHWVSQPKPRPPRVPVGDRVGLVVVGTDTPRPRSVRSVQTCETQDGRGGMTDDSDTLFSNAKSGT